jgi:hypothetical protein
MVVDAVDVPAVRGGVLAWVVGWFVLGYALYAMVYGALGSLASRTEDAQSVAGPVIYVLLAAYWASFLAVSADPDSGWSQLLSLFPATAPFAMPARIALGVAAWWEPLVAAALALAAIGGLTVFAGRVYTASILHTGPTLSLRDAWRHATTPRPGAPQPSTRHLGTRRHALLLNGEGRGKMTRTQVRTNRLTVGVLILAVGLGAAVAVLGNDVIIGLIVGAAFFAVVSRVAKAWAGHSDRHASHP